MQKLRRAVLLVFLTAESVPPLLNSAEARGWSWAGLGIPNYGYIGSQYRTPSFDGYPPGYYSYGYASAPYGTDRQPSTSRFEGKWNIVAQTTRGHCESIQFGLGISGSRIHSAGGSYGGYAAQLGGRVSPSGNVQLNAVAGPRVARANGRLQTSQGRGTWTGRGPSGVCSGVWTAYRSTF